MACAALECSGVSRSSALKRYLLLPGTFTRKPLVEPPVLPLSTTQVPSAASVPSSTCEGAQAPRSSSSSPSGLTPIRLVNQEESGTSSRLLTSIDSPPVTTPRASDAGRNSRLSRPSQMRVASRTSGAQETCAGSFLSGARWHGAVTGVRSGSRHTGARSGNDRSVAAHAAVSAAGTTSERSRARPRARPAGAVCESEAMVHRQRDANGVDLAAVLERLRADAHDALDRVVRQPGGRDPDVAGEAQQLRAEPLQVRVEDVADRALDGAPQPRADRPRVAQSGGGGAPADHAAREVAAHRSVPAQRRELGERDRRLPERIGEARGQRQAEHALVLVEVPEAGEHGAVADPARRRRGAEAAALVGLQLDARAVAGHGPGIAGVE